MNISFSLKKSFINAVYSFLERHAVVLLIIFLSAISILSFMYFSFNHLSLSYNDARSHLDIGRRVVEGLKPGLAQIGSVWLPLPHILMIPTIWNDFMWHSGLAGAIQSMISFVATGILIYLFLKQLGADMLSRIFAVFVFVTNINVLYLQSTAMTELLLLATMTAAIYELVLWHKHDEQMLHLIKAAFFVMLTTLIRYDGWFLLAVAASMVVFHTFRKKGLKVAEGTTVFFLTLAATGIGLWVLWNLLIFKDPLYFAFGPYSAHAQQLQLGQAGVLATKHHWLLSAKIYIYALAYNSYAFSLLFGLGGLVLFLRDKAQSSAVRIASLALLTPLFFNVLALYLGHSVLFIQGISGNTWFNARYGVLMMPSIAIFMGYLVYKAKAYRYLVIGLFVFYSLFVFGTGDAVTIDDARVGSSQKNVSEVSGWLNVHTKDKEGFILISAASHDAIIFSSGLPMKKFIHEGTGAYWESATTAPDRWARWLVMRTNDKNDITFKAVSKTHALSKYHIVAQYPFADIYELNPEFVSQLQTKAVFVNQK